MRKEYRNTALEELSDTEKTSEIKMVDWKTVTIRSCSQFQSFGYLRNIGFHGISNNKQMNSLFRFALASYDNGLFTGTGMVFLDTCSADCCFATIKAVNVESGVAILSRLEKMCEIANIKYLKLTNISYIRKVIACLDRERGPYERYDERDGSFIKLICKD